jgi:hypothetical protein
VRLPGCEQPFVGLTNIDGHPYFGTHKFFLLFVWGFIGGIITHIGFPSGAPEPAEHGTLPLERIDYQV